MAYFQYPKSMQAGHRQSEPCLPLAAPEHRGWESQVPWMTVYQGQWKLPFSGSSPRRWELCEALCAPSSRVADRTPACKRPGL